MQKEALCLELEKYKCQYDKSDVYKNRDIIDQCWHEIERVLSV